MVKFGNSEEIMVSATKKKNKNLPWSGIFIPNIKGRVIQRSFTSKVSKKAFLNYFCFFILHIKEKESTSVFSNIGVCETLFDCM